MSANVLIFNDKRDHFQFYEVTDGSNRIGISINGQANYIDRNQAHLLMLWLQEHLK